MADMSIIQGTPNPNMYPAVQQGIADSLANSGAIQQQQGAAQSQQVQAFALQQAQQQAAAQQAQQAAYNQGVSALIANPSSGSKEYSDLALRFPDQAKSVTAAWDAKSKAQQDSERQSLAMAFSSIQNGHPEIAQKIFEDKIAGDQAADKPNPNTIALLNTIKTDPTHAAGIMKFVLSSIPGGDNFSSNIKALNDGDGGGGTHVISQGGALVDDTGKVLYQADGKPTYEKIKGPDGVEHLVQIPGTSGNAQPSGGGDINARIMAAEGTAPNPASSANGPGQFVNSTFRQYVGQVSPQIAQQIAGMSDGQLTTYRKVNAAQLAPIQQQMVGQLTSANQAALTNAGVPASDANTYMAHVFGAGGTASAINAGPSAPAAKYVGGTKALTNNGLPANATVGQVQAWASSRIGSASATPGGARDITPTTLGGGDPASSGPFGVPNGATGGDVMNALPPQIRSRVQQLLDGRSILTAREKGSPQGQQLMEAANMADPTFSEATSMARYKEQLQYTGQGKGAQTVASADRLAYHLNDLYRNSLALSGPDTGWAPLSNLLTSGAQSLQQAQVGQYKATLPFIAGELQKLTKNGASTEGESKLIMENLAPGQPTDVRNAAIKQLVELAQGQIQPLRASWDSAYGGTYKPKIPMDFSPTTQKIFDAISNGQQPLQIDHNGNVVGQHQHQQQASPAQQQAPHPAMPQLPAGATRPAYNPQTRQWAYMINGQWHYHQ